MPVSTSTQPLPTMNKASAAGLSRVLVWITCLVVLAGYAYLFALELRQRGDMPLQIDELFFATCAARGLAVGEIPISGCHDNKGPLVYVVYQALQAVGGLYPLALYKIAAFVLGLLNAALVCVTVARSAGRTAGFLGAAALLVLYVQDPWVLALKPESLGMAFVLSAMLLVPGLDARVRPWRWACVGLLFGMALATKQTFLFPLLGLLVWLSGASWAAQGWRVALARLVAVGLAAAVPLLAFATVFWLAGRGLDFAAALLLYPMLYKSTAVVGLIKGLALRLSALAGFWTPLLPLLGAFVLVLVAYFSRMRRARLGWQAPHLAYVCVTLGAFVVLLASPIIMRFHLFPAAALAVVVVALCLLGSAPVASPEGAAGQRWVGRAALLWALVVTLGAWGGPAGNPLRDRKILVTHELKAPRGAYAYVVGIWPKLYVDNGLVPASDVLYPTAFPGAPMLWSYQEPAPGTAKARMLADLHRHNIERLLADFAKTPPEVVVVVEGEGRAENSNRASDIAVLDNYIAGHCRPDELIDIPGHIRAQVYACQR